MSGIARKDAASREIRIRKMRTEDLEGAMSILRQWNMAPRQDLTDAERSEIRVENSFVAERGDRIVGTASYIVHSPEEAETASLAVDPEFRGLGIGARLQEARLREMHERGVRRVRTETDRPATIRWYVEKFGYEKLGTNPKKHEFSLPDEDEWTVLELDLETWAERSESGD